MIAFVYDDFDSSPFPLGRRFVQLVQPRVGVFSPARARRSDRWKQGHVLASER